MVSNNSAAGIDNIWTKLFEPSMNIKTRWANQSVTVHILFGSVLLGCYGLFLFINLNSFLIVSIRLMMVSFVLSRSTSNSKINEKDKHNYFVRLFLACKHHN